MKKITKPIIIAIVCSFIFALVVVFGGEKAMQVTGTEPFCGSCHKWDGFAAQAHVIDPIHGGANPKGIKAKCVDCHLPSGLAYLPVKAKTGISEVFIAISGDASKKDWQENRAQRAHFTYDSACLSCHENVLDTKGKSEVLIKMHAKYVDLKNTSNSLNCVSCHKFVGHKDLGKAIFDKNNTLPKSWEEWESLRSDFKK